MPNLTPARIGARRARIARRTPARRVRTPAGALRFVDELGFCFFWPIKGFSLPDLFQAIAGRERAVPMEHDDPDISRCWNWKDQALSKRQWYYGKLLAKRATLIALGELPYFYALSSNYGDPDDYLEEYAAGQLTADAKAVYEALLHHGALDTVRLRRESHLAAENAKTRFDRALVDLQAGLKVIPVGVAEAGAWRYAFVYELVTRHFPGLAEQARAITRREARARLVSRYVANTVAVRRAELERAFAVLKWTKGEWEATLAELLDQRQIVLTRIDGWEGEWLLPRG
jgi:hypothetical protein